MASCITEQWKGSVCPQARLTVTTTSDNATSMTVQWVVEYVTHDGYSAHTNGIPRDWKVTINGSQVGSGSYNINYVSSTREIGRGTYTISKGYSGQNISFGLSFYFDVSWSGVYRGTMTASGSFWLGAKNYYTVSYYANGGSWSPSNQTKWHDENLTLSHSHATRTGYKFKGWSTSTDSSIEYYAGSTYTGNSNLNLYAVWEADTYTVSYNANGGSNAPANQTKYYNTNLTLSSTRPTRTNYNFIGWGTSSGSTSADYQPGGTYTSNAPITLYAIWELAYLKPRITDVSVDRCNPDGTLSEEGTNAKVVCKWATDRPVTEIALWSKQVPNGSWVKYASTPNGTTSGSINQVIGNSTLSSDFNYSICIEIKDGSTDTYKSSVYRDLPQLEYIIDISEDGTGVAFGRPATNSNSVDFARKIRMENGFEMKSPSGYYRTPLKLTGANVDGDNIVMEAGGGVIIGSGESPSKYIKDVSSPYVDYNETVILTSDYGVDIVTNMQNSASSRWTYKFQNDGYFSLPDRSAIKRNGCSCSWVNGRDYATYQNRTIDGYSPFSSIKTNDGSWDIGVYNDSGHRNDLIFSYISDADYKSGNNRPHSQYRFSADGIVDHAGGLRAINAPGWDYAYRANSGYNGGNDGLKILVFWSTVSWQPWSWGSGFYGTNIPPIAIPAGIYKRAPLFFMGSAPYSLANNLWMYAMAGDGSTSTTPHMAAIRAGGVATGTTVPYSIIAVGV